MQNSTSQIQLSTEAMPLMSLLQKACVWVQKHISEWAPWLRRALSKGISQVTGHWFLLPMSSSPFCEDWASPAPKGERNFQAVDLVPVLRRAGLEEPEPCRQAVDPGHSLSLLVLAFLGGCTITGGHRQFSGGQKLMALPSGALVWRSFGARLSPVPHLFCPFSETTISRVSSPRIFSRSCGQFFLFPLLWPIVSTVSTAKISHYPEELHHQVII